jgi:hypothetical protein
MRENDTAGEQRPRAWSTRRQGVSLAAWTSFIIACFETMIVFAFLDPATLGVDGLAPTLGALRPMLYACGFFFFWSFAFIGAALTAYMLESGPREMRPDRRSGDTAATRAATDERTSQVRT